MTQSATFRSSLLLLVLLGIATVGFLLLRTDLLGVPEGAPAGGTTRKVQPAPAVTDVSPDSSAVAALGSERVAVTTVKRAEEPTVQAPTVRATGRLVDAQSRPVAGQEVELQVGADHAPADPRVRFLGEDRTKYQAREQVTSAADGTFVLHLPTGVLARIVPGGEEVVFQKGPLDLDPRLADAPLGDLVVQQACVLAGAVRDLRGALCPGVTVLCGTESNNFDESRASRQETGDDGRFRFAGLANGSFRLLCRSPQFAQQSRTLELLPEQRLLDVAFALDAGGAIAGIVVDDAGAPVAEAEVRATPAKGGGSAARGKSAADGSFVVGGLTGTSYTLLASAKGYRRDKANAVATSPGARDVSVRLSRAASIAGIVVDDAGAPVQGSRVRAVPASQTVEQDRQQILFNPGMLTGADGRFAFNDLGGGDYRVVASGPHLETVTPVRAPAGQPVLDLRIPVQRGGVVRITVLSPDNAPVAGARVRIAEQSVPDHDRPMVLIGASDFDPEDLYLGQRVARVTSDERGVALVAGLLPATYGVRVAADAGVQEQPMLFTLPVGEEGAVTVRLARAGFAMVEVTDARGNRLPRKRVELEGPLGATKPIQSGGDTGSDGTVRLGPFAAGRYTAAIGKAVDTDAFGGGVLVMSGGGPSLLSTRVEFSVRKGETVDVRLVRPDLATLCGTLRDDRGPIANGRVQVGSADPDRQAGMRYGLDGSTRSVRTRPDGTFTIVELEPGSYRVRYGKPKQELLAEQTVMLVPGADGAPLDLLVQCGTLRVTVRSAHDQKLLAGAQAKLRRVGDGEPAKDLGIPDYAFPRTLTADVTTDAQGIAEFADVPFGRYVVEVAAARHQKASSAPVAVDTGTADVGIIELQRAGRIIGTLVDASGAEAGGGYAEYRSVSAKDFQPGDGGRGKFEIDGLESGDYVLRARRFGNSGQTNQGTPGPEITVHVEAGATATVSLRLPVQ